MPETPLKDVMQLGIVSADVDRAVRTWADRYGVGPWSVFHFDPANMTELTVGGRPVEYAMKIALAMLGPMMLEIIEPLDDRSIYATSLAEHGGRDHIHHVLCGCDDYEATLADFRARGVEPRQTGHMTETDATFAYLGTEADLGFALEIVKMPAELNLPEPILVYPSPA
jgi:hypothetical protein